MPRTLLCMSGLRFCMVTTFYPPFNFGGDGIGVQRLSQALVRRGHHVTVVHDLDAYRWLHAGPPTRVSPDSSGVRVIRLQSQFGVLSALLTHQVGYPMFKARAIRRVFRDGRFDVINFHNVSLLGGPAVLSMGQAVKLYTAHEHWLVCPTHVLWRHRREVCTGRQCVRCCLRYRRPVQLWRYTGALERRLEDVDTFVAVSEFSRDKHRQFGFPREMEVLPYFLPDAATEMAGAVGTPPHDRPYFLFVGRLEQIKGLDDVIRVFRHYEGADLLVAGEGSHDNTLRTLAADNPRVVFLGRVASEELPRYYKHAVALIAPSVGYETFGIVLIEAFREGTPVIARRIGPFPEIVGRCGGGELFGEPAELLAALKRMQGDVRYRERLGRAASEGFAMHWSESTVLPRYLDLVRRTAAAKDRVDIVRVLESAEEQAAVAARPPRPA